MDRDSIKSLRNYAITFLVATIIGFIVGRCSVVAEQQETEKIWKM